jgi:hypothetical protein
VGTPDEREVQALLIARDDDLLVMLGEALFPGGAGFGSDDQDYSQRLAERWIDDHLEELKRIICVHPLVVQILAEEDGKLKVTDVAIAIGNLVAFANSISIGGATALAVLLIRGGLPRFCGTRAD